VKDKIRDPILAIGAGGLAEARAIGATDSAAARASTRACPSARAARLAPFELLMASAALPIPLLIALLIPLLVALASTLLFASDARAIDTLPGAQVARFTWAPSTGDVAGYEVRVSVNGTTWHVAGRTTDTSFELRMAPDDQILVKVAAYDLLGVLGPESPVSQLVNFVPAPLPLGRVAGKAFGLASRDIPIVGSWRSGARPGHGIALPGSQGWVFASVLGSTIDVVEFGDVNIDQPIVGDWDGDGDADPGVYREYNGELVFHLKTDQGIRSQSFGDPAIDLPVIGDWNGDGIDDVGVYRPFGDPAQIVFHLSLPNNRVQTYAFGIYDTDVPVSGDWDGDGIDDIGVARPFRTNTLLFYLQAGGGVRVERMDDAVGGVPISADWNGDGFDDVGVAIPNQFGQWHFEYLVLDPQP